MRQPNALVTIAALTLIVLLGVATTAQATFPWFTVNQPGTQFVIPGNSGSTSMTISITDPFCGAGSGSFSFSKVSGPSWVSVSSGYPTGIISWNPPSGTPTGSYSVTIEARGLSPECRWHKEQRTFVINVC